MATFATLRAKILSILQGITSLAFVYDFHNSNLEGYPSATFDVSDNSGEFLSNKENLRQITYNIVLYQETKIKGLDTATSLLDTIADEVITAFETNFNLDGEVDWCIPLLGPRGQFQSPLGLVLFQELRLQCRFAVVV